MRIIFQLLIVFFISGLIIENANSEYVPNWIKNTAGWWATDQISEIEFLNAIEFLVSNEIIQISDLVYLKM